MMKKGKKEEKFCCGEHTFVLRPIGSKCYYREPVKSNFCLNYDRTRKRCYEGPVFNQDKNCQTHSFVLNSQKKKYLKTAYLGAFDEDVQMQNYDEKSNLIAPKPNKRSTYCNVCKERYNDYAQHIRDPSHLANIRRTRANQAIKELERKYQRERCQSKDKEPTQTLSEFSNVIIIDQEDLDHNHSAPVKRSVGHTPIDVDEEGPPKFEYRPQPRNFDIPPPPNTQIKRIG